MSSQMAATIRTAQAFILPEEGHYSLPIEHAPEILRQLLEAGGN